MKLIWFAIISILFAYSSVSNADDYTVSITASYMNKATVFGITDKSTDDEKATFVDIGNAPFIQIATSDLINSETSNWQLVIEAAYTDFEVGVQDDNGTERDLGTSIDGKYFYVMPVFYYSRVSHDEDGLKVGLGAGLASLEANGTAIYTETSDPTVHTIAVDDTGLIMSATIAYHFSGFHARFRIIGASFLGSDKSGDNNNYAVGEAGVDLGYSLYF